MSATGSFSDTVMTFRGTLRCRIAQTKVKRYWPGKAPEWADHDAEEEEEEDIRTAGRRFSHVSDDLPLRRVAKDNEARADRRRRIQQAEIIASTEEENMNNQQRLEDDQADDDERRKRIREEYLLLRLKDEVALLPEEEEESEYETDSDDVQSGIVMVKAIFVPKSGRDTIEERERLEAEERAREEMAKKRLEERRVETKQIVVQEIRKDEAMQKNSDVEAIDSDVDTDDEVNEAEEYEAWKGREAARIKRDTEVKEKMEKVRKMTEEEGREWEWERRNPKPVPLPKKRRRFMQRYYHKGAFFQADGDDSGATAGTDEICKRDFSAPTGEDKMNKRVLPKLMQVKNFGRSGRTKWTHLVNEDTSEWNNSWTIVKDQLRANYWAKMVGMNAPIAKPKGSKKLKDWELN